MTTVSKALAAARAAGIDRLDAQLLLAHHLDKDRAWLIGHPEATLDAPTSGRYRDDCARRAGGEPLAYIIGRWTFRGLPLQVSPAVLVPRPETELLVEWALELLDTALAERAEPRVADLGTGSGAIALAVARACARASVIGTDISAEALAEARANARALGAASEWRHGDWWAPLAGCRFDLILSNPPYVADTDPHLDALAHEPRTALAAGADGLDALRRIVDGSARHLAPGGWLLLEHGHDQASTLRALLQSRHYADITTRADLAGWPRCTGGRLA